MKKKKSFLVTGLLCFFLGGFGAHRFYTGDIIYGIAQLLTNGGCIIWALIDLIMISIGKYKDSDGEELEGYTPWFGWIILGVTIFCVTVCIIYFLLLK